MLILHLDPYAVPRPHHMGRGTPFGGQLDPLEWYPEVISPTAAPERFLVWQNRPN